MKIRVDSLKATADEDVHTVRPVSSDQAPSISSPKAPGSSDGGLLGWKDEHAREVAVDASVPETDAQRLFLRAHDAFSTLNGVVLLAFVALAAIFGCLLMVVERKVSGGSATMYVARGPVLIAAGVGVLMVLAVAGAARNNSDLSRPKRDLFRVMGLSLFLVSAGLAVWAVLSRSPVVWEVRGEAGAELLQDRTDEAIFFSVAAVALVAFAVSNINGSFRADRMEALSTGTLSTIVLALVLGFGSASFMRISYETAVMGVGREWSRLERMGLYALLASGLFVVLVFGLFCFDHLFAWLSARGSGYGPLAPDVIPGAMHFKSLTRTKQTMRAAVLLLVIVPAVLVWNLAGGGADPQGAAAAPTDVRRREWRNIGVTVVATMLLLAVVTAMAMEIWFVTRWAYTLVSNLLFAGAFFLFASRFVPWNETTCFVLLLAWAALLLRFISLRRASSNLSVAAVFGGSFVLISLSSRLIFKRLSADGTKPVSEAVATMVWMVPALFLGIIWMIRGYLAKQGFQAALVFLCFVVIYGVSFFDPKRDLSDSAFLKDGDLYSNVGVEFVIVTTLAMLVTAFSSFGSHSATAIQEFVLQRETPVTTTTFLFVLVVFIAFIMSYVFTKLKSWPEFKDFMAEMQGRAENTAALFRRDARAQ